MIVLSMKLSSFLLAHANHHSSRQVWLRPVLPNSSKWFQASWVMLMLSWQPSEDRASGNVCHVVYNISYSGRTALVHEPGNTPLSASKLLFIYWRVSRLFAQSFQRVRSIQGVCNKLTSPFRISTFSSKKSNSNASCKIKQISQLQTGPTTN